MKTIIEEDIWDIETKSPIMKATFIYDENEFSRELYRTADPHRNGVVDKVEVFTLDSNDLKDSGLIDVDQFENTEISIKVPYESINSLKPKLKKIVKDMCLKSFRKNTIEEAKGFNNPTITEYD